jgi:energy-coupling factor transporter ATP-binding protein EcfA2
MLIVEHKADLLAGLCSRVVVIDAGRIALDGETAAVLGDRRLVGWGVEPPSSVRLGRALEARGLEPGLIAGSTA